MNRPCLPRRDGAARFVHACVLALASLAVAAPARAQYDEMINLDEESKIESPERFTLTLNIGMYQPSVGNSAFETVFGNDNGPFVGGEIHGLIYRIPYVGPIGAGVGMGWARYEASACSNVGGVVDCTMRSGEEAKLTLWPLTFMASLRIDVLARELNVPLVITPKIGLDSVFYRSETGAVTEASGASIGLRWAVEFALELDLLERRAARALDEEWGINHTFIFFQLFGSTAQSQLPVGDPFAWTAGLGFVF